MKKREPSVLYPLHIFYWAVIIIGFVVTVVQNFNDYSWLEIVEGIKENIAAKGIISTLSDFIFFFFICVFSVALKVYPLTMLYFAIFIGYLMFVLFRLDKADFKSKEYYREILPSMSAATLSYIDDFKISHRDVISTLLELELKKKIKIEDEIIIIDSDETYLCENEKYIFKLVKSKKIKEVNIIEFKNEVIKDCKNNKLIETKAEAKKSALKYIIWCVVIYIILILLFVNLPHVARLINIRIIEYVFAMILMILFFVVILYPFMAIYTLFTYIAFKTDEPYVRSAKGKKLNGSLEGMRKYIKEYSKLSNKNKDSLVLWEEYLIYSVILGVNNKIVNELTEKIIK